MTPASPSPEIGQCVLVRRRPAVVMNAIASPGGRDGRVTHLIDVEYLDGYSHPSADRIVWERETDARLLAAYDLPTITTQPDRPERFHAYLDALRWSSQGIYTVDGDAVTYAKSPLLAPHFSAVQVEDYQLFPVLQALAMPRVNLLLADDVGLGKTIEAGLIIQELIRQRRIRRILIVCPASLQVQWQEEMREKFALEFVVLDSDQVWSLQRTLGVDANPWRLHPRLIVSMDYLKQPDVLRRFIDTGRQGSTGSAMLPWDLLIVDEAHNFTPSPGGDDSQRSQTLREIAPYFEHRLFLTATPHNGYTFSFSGLLELLDPVRFQQARVLGPEMMRHLGLVMIRRTKEELNRDLDPPRFPRRQVVGLDVRIDGPEAELYDAVRTYRIDGIERLGRGSGRERVLAQFLFSLLTKRLLSSTYAFARTWWQHVAGFDLAGFGVDEAEASRRRAETPIEDDEEKGRRETDVVRLGGSWLRPHREVLAPHIARIGRALERLGWTADRVRDGSPGGGTFPPDARFDLLLAWIRENLGAGDERLIVFTEYKDTLDYLVARLAEAGLAAPEVETLFGGDSAAHRAAVKAAFNDQDSPVRILVATDAASEGLNLQTACRYVLHQEIPWNPMRLEQRNGRVDRHGQWRDVTVFHFVSDQVEDLRFLDFIVKKVETVRTDLGSVGRVLDEAVTDWFAGRRIDQAGVDAEVASTLATAEDRHDLALAACESQAAYTDAFDAYEATTRRLGLEEGRLARLLDQAARLESGALASVGDGGYRFERFPPGWRRMIEETLLLNDAGMHGAQPRLVFSPARAERVVNGRRLFSPGRGVRLLSLGHPVMQKALGAFTRRVWLPPEQAGLAKWTIEAAPLDGEPVAVIVYSVALRNRLGERIQTGLVELPVALGPSPSVLSAGGWAALSAPPTRAVAGSEVAPWRSRLAGGWPALKAFAEAERDRLGAAIAASSEIDLAAERDRQIEEQEGLYAERRAALERQREPRELERLKQELLRARQAQVQTTLSEEVNRRRKQEFEALRARLEDAEWARRQQSHLDLLRDRLEQERARVVEQVLPNRFALDDDGVEIFPIAVRVLVPAREAGQ